MRPFLLRYERELKFLVLAVIYLSFFAPIIVGVRFLFPFVFPKAIYLQTLMELGFLFYFGLLCANRAYLPRFNWILGMVGIYLLLMGITTFLGVDPALSFWSKAERMDGFFQYLHLGVFLVFLLAVVRNEADWMRLFRFIILTGWLTGILALISKYFPQILGFGDQTRLGATFGNPAFLSTYYLVMTFLALIFVLRARTPVERGIYSISTAFFLLLLLLSGTRGAYVGLIVGIFAFLFFLLLEDWKRWVKPVLVVVLVLAFLALDIYVARDLLWELSRTMTSRIFGLWQFPPARLVSWKIGLDAFRARPIVGWGPENYIYAFNTHFDPNIHTYELSLFDRAHNKIIDLLVFHGILGPVVYLLLFGIIFWELFRVLRKKIVNPIWPAGFFGLMVGYFVQNLVLFEMPTSGLLFFFLLGFLSWLAAEVKEEDKKRQPRAQVEPQTKGTPSGLLPGWSLPVGFLLIGVSFYSGILLPYRAARGVVSAAAALGNQNVDLPTRIADGLASYRQARDHSTFLDREVDVLLGRRLRELNSLQQDSATTPLSQEFLTRLMTNLEDDSRRHPLDYDILIELGNLSFTLESQKPELQAKTRDYWEKAIALAPKREDAYQQLSLWYMNRGDDKNADLMLQKLLALNDKVGIFWWYRAVFEVRRGNDVAAKEALENAKNYNYPWDKNQNNLEFLADTYSRQNRFRQAVPYYEMILEIPGLSWPQEFRARAKLIRAYLALGERGNAVPMAQILREHTPEEQKSQLEAFLHDLGL